LTKVRKFRFWPKFENLNFDQSSKISILAIARKFRFWPKFENFNFLYLWLQQIYIISNKLITNLKKNRQFRFWQMFENFDFGQSSEIFILPKVFCPKQIHHFWSLSTSKIQFLLKSLRRTYWVKIVFCT